MNRDRGRTPLVEMASSLSLILFALGGLVLVLRLSGPSTPLTAPAADSTGPPPIVGPPATPLSILVQFPDRLTIITQTPPPPTPTPYQTPVPAPTQPFYCPHNPDTLPTGTICEGPPPQPPTPLPMSRCESPPLPTVTCVVKPATPTPTPVTDSWPVTP